MDKADGIFCMKEMETDVILSPTIFGNIFFARRFLHRSHQQTVDAFLYPEITMETANSIVTVIEPCF